MTASVYPILCAVCRGGDGERDEELRMKRVLECVLTIGVIT
jgi:hypothetical protein